MLKETLFEDLKNAMKNKDTVASNAIRQIKAAITEEECRGTAHEADDTTIIKLIQKLIKQHNDSAMQFAEAGRLDLSDAELAERCILERYVPKMLTENEMEGMIDKIIETLPEKNMAAMGTVMKELNTKYPGRVDGKFASQYIRIKLA